jgi:hypothetical protein
VPWELLEYHQDQICLLKGDSGCSAENGLEARVGAERSVGGQCGGPAQK